MAWTRPHPMGDLPKSCHAIGESRSVSQYRLPRRKRNVSPGSSSTGTWRAPGTTGSGRPLSFTMASEKIRMCPGGGTIRVHQLSNESLYPVEGHEGSVHTGSGTTTSAAREGWMLSARIMGVACGQEYVNS